MVTVTVNQENNVSRPSSIHHILMNAPFRRYTFMRSIGFARCCSYLKLYLVRDGELYAVPDGLQSRFVKIYVRALATACTCIFIAILNVSIY